MGAEAGDGSAPNFGADDVIIANNIIVGTNTGIGWWDDDSNTRASNTYQRVQIVSNVIWSTTQSAIMFDAVPSGRTAPSATLTNNIIYEGSGGTALQIGNAAAWTITDNLFPDGKPTAASDASNIAGDPMLAAPALAAAAEAFRPSATSPARHAGRPVGRVPLDYACATRGTADTTIGAFE